MSVSCKQILNEKDFENLKTQIEDSFKGYTDDLLDLFDQTLYQTKLMYNNEKKLIERCKELQSLIKNNQRPT